MNAEKRRSEKEKGNHLFPPRLWFLSAFICVNLWLIILPSCTTKPSDLRSLVPAETLVYLETNDLAASLQPIVDSKPFREVAKSKPDFSALKGVQVAVAVTGFETSEVAVTDEQAVGKVQPRFVAVADTHAWNYQAVAFAEKKLGSFVTEIYDAEPKLEKSDKHGGKYFTWTSPNVGDGRKAFALVIDSLIYFGNDESAIDKALSVRNGQADSIAKTGKLPPHVPGNLASGYVSTDGVAQIAALAGLHFASQASDEEEVQSAVAGILPQLIRGTVTDVSWSTSQTSEGIEDKWSVTMPAEVAASFGESFAAQDESQIATYQKNEFTAQLPESTFSATLYNLKDPQLAWRSLLTSGAKRLDPMAGRVLSEFASLLFEPYGIRDPEQFLGSFGDPRFVSRSIVTAKLDEQSDDTVAVLATGDYQARTKSFVADLKPPKQIAEMGENIWTSDGENLQIVLDVQMTKIGSKEDLKRVKGMRSGESRDIKSDLLRRLANSNAPLSTIGRDRASTIALVDFLYREGHGDTQAMSTYLTETRFTKTGMERRTVSDFGFIGWMIAQLAAE